MKGTETGLMKTVQAARLILSLFVAAMLLLSSGGERFAAHAQTASAPGPETKQIEEVVRAYLMRHPEVLIDALTAYQQRKEQDERAAQKVAFSNARSVLLSDPGSPTGGNREGDVTVVEFFDYQCPYCKTASTTLHNLLSEDRGLRVVYKELPILGPASVVGAKAALAVARQGMTQYVAFHRALMDNRGPISLQTVLDLARGLGIDVQRLQRDMDHPAVAEQIARNLELARTLGISGTPAFVIGDELVPGAIARQELVRLVAKARGG